MTRQHRRRRARRKERTEPEYDPPRRTPAQVRVDELDELLDEIDRVLEDQAVLVNFRQRSGE